MEIDEPRKAKKKGGRPDKFRGAKLRAAAAATEARRGGDRRHVGRPTSAPETWSHALCNVAVLLHLACCDIAFSVALHYTVK